MNGHEHKEKIRTLAEEVRMKDQLIKSLTTTFNPEEVPNLKKKLQEALSELKELKMALSQAKDEQTVYNLKTAVHTGCSIAEALASRAIFASLAKFYEGLAKSKPNRYGFDDRVRKADDVVATQVISTEEASARYLECDKQVQYWTRLISQANSK